MKQSLDNDEVDLLSSLQLVGTKTAVDIVKKGVSIDSEEQEMGPSPSKEADPVVFTDEEALALYLDLSLTKRKYCLLRELLQKKNVNVLPAYKRITDAKSKCYPVSSAIEITETKASIKLQELLNHTTTILLSTEEVKPPLDAKKLKMVSKYGGDGTSGFNNYKQKFENSEDSDSSLFLMSLVPLRLEYEIGNTCSTIWENPRPCSPRNCLPIMFEYAKETKEKILTEFGNIKKVIKQLKPTKITINSKIYQIDHVLLSTMIDGKVCQHLTGISSAANCVICGAKPSEMNDLKSVLKREENIEAFGLQVLHLWIRIMECVLNISYRLPLKKWACKTKEDKAIRDERKTKIKKEIKDRLGLIVDTPKPGGAGSSNDGNTARRFLENYEIISDITGFNKVLLKKFYIMLQTLSSGKPICTDAFRKFTFKTAELYVELYYWYYMPSSLHKPLMHGYKIIKSQIVPIGQLSEEAQEAKNKDFKRWRENNTRKTSRVDTNTDLIHYLLVSADLYISSLRKEFPKSQKPLLPEATALLLKE